MIILMLLLQANLLVPRRAIVAHYVCAHMCMQAHAHQNAMLKDACRHLDVNPLLRTRNSILSQARASHLRSALGED